ncbi:LysR family transcriptional regulator [Asticcacaulis sp. AC466]|uniref:LysR family transcriptional regulator n=1 Tax=Asticcacaulis sp. AC466 TaxID=1282362 RepID=UPI0003FDEC85|nr:LysR family transcriptional regulator [Asticcacaulis sp. AC466]
MDRLSAMQVFVRVVESGSFSAVARERSTTQSTISKQIAALEDYLGVKLLSRSTRALSLTEGGERYFEEARRLVAELGAAEELVRSGTRQLTGWLRVATSVGYGRRVLMPRVTAFLEANPAVKIDLNLNDGFIDLIESGIDLAIRLGDLSDSSLIARRIGSSRRLLLCARSYAERIGVTLPELGQPQDMKHHNCIGYTELPTNNSWEFVGPDGGAVPVRIAGNLQSNSSEAIRAAALAGMGICYVPDWLFAPEIASGEMVVLLPHWTTKLIPITAVVPAHRRNVAKIEALISFLTP